VDALNKEEWSPLMVACAEGQTQVIKYLLHVGANIELRSTDGMTTLHLAAKNGHLEAVHIILSYGDLSPRRRLLNQTVRKLLTVMAMSLGHNRPDINDCQLLTLVGSPRATI